MKDVDRRRIQLVREAMSRYRNRCSLVEGSLPFVIYRTDSNHIIARNIYGYENAKDKANEFRKKLGLKWDDIKFKVDRPSMKKSERSAEQFSTGGKIVYAKRYNPSKGRRFRGYYTSSGDYADLD